MLKKLNISKLVFLGISITLLVSCERRSSVPNIELVQDMMKDPAVKAQDYDLEKKDKRANFLPPENTVPMNWTSYPKNFLTDEDAKDYKNPLTPNKEILARGKDRFDIYCAICHGFQGHGDGTVAEKMLVKPPTLVEDKIKGWTDGQIFHLITKGRGMMGSYESQIPDYKDRWSVVLYVRELQGKIKESQLPNAPETNNENQ